MGTLRHHGHRRSRRIRRSVRSVSPAATRCLSPRWDASGELGLRETSGAARRGRDDGRRRCRRRRFRRASKPISPDKTAAMSFSATDSPGVEMRDTAGTSGAAYALNSLIGEISTSYSATPPAQQGPRRLHRRRDQRHPALRRQRLCLRLDHAEELRDQGVFVGDRGGYGDGRFPRGLRAPMRPPAISTATAHRTSCWRTRARSSRNGPCRTGLAAGGGVIDNPSAYGFALASSASGRKRRRPWRRKLQRGGGSALPHRPPRHVDERREQIFQDPARAGLDLHCHGHAGRQRHRAALDVERIGVGLEFWRRRRDPWSAPRSGSGSGRRRRP